MISAMPGVQCSHLLANGSACLRHEELIAAAAAQLASPVCNCSQRAVGYERLRHLSAHSTRHTSPGLTFSHFISLLQAANLADLQITNCLGEGGFAKVFRGLWRGLVVGIKVVCDDGKNEKMVMKNAHEIAILG
jgi:hypothetical protein